MLLDIFVFIQHFLSRTEEKEPWRGKAGLRLQLLHRDCIVAEFRSKLCNEQCSVTSRVQALCLAGSSGLFGVTLLKSFSFSLSFFLGGRWWWWWRKALKDMETILPPYRSSIPLYLLITHPPSLWAARPLLIHFIVYRPTAQSLPSLTLRIPRPFLSRSLLSFKIPSTDEPGHC